ncbi:polyadenylate-binding protein 3-like isoform X1 [Gastrolobium bilobum]|uniref:polyadenylate-binding protein 3-like isoform X1 n=1 Tax=Gastrolobium bilobum TaxID=150636 RepID=UPI002AAF55C9|nr:polyadenylate-binding protein 3-like isoform X1 [Gastrolobium bilobum]XP_061345159.1 polyadenylate-binding protein 3-like isoform X1 [Gastrolobium bilobum]
MAAAISSPMAQSAASVAPATAPVAAALAGGPFSNASLYVGDLEGNVNETQLYDLFNRVAPVVSIRVCRDQAKRSSLGYAYVNFGNAQDAANAMELLNFTPLNGKPIRIMLSQRDPSIRKSGYANVFIKNLETSIDNKALHDTFATFGTVLSCKVAVDSNGQSKGYGFVQFDKEEAAQNAIKQLNGMLVNDKQVYVGLFVRHQERTHANGSPKFTNVYVKTFSETYTDEDLKKLFSPYGTITSATVMKDMNGKSRCFGFVNFQSPDSAANAVERLNGTTVLDDKVLYVGRAQRKAEREAELKAKFEQERNSRYEKLQGSNLYLKNLDDNFSEEKLKDLFSEFGTITSCKVMLDAHGHSKGSGFVAFSTPEEASKALIEMNGKLIGQKPLYVAVAQRKEERKAHLQAHFAQIRAPAGMAPLPAGIPGYHPGAPRLAPQQLYFGQGSPGFIPPQPAGFGFQQQILPGMRPGVAPNFIMPYHLQRQGQPGQRMGVRRNGNLQQVQQNQMLHRNSDHGFRYMANGRNGMDPSVVPQGLVGPIMPMPFDGSGVTAAPIDNQRPGASSTTLASALASATPDNQRLMLGEHLYPLVERLTSNQHTAKVTGMLLEMDQSEVIHLIESPEDLKIKVSEAMQVLREAASGSEVGDQLGSLSLNK